MTISLSARAAFLLTLGSIAVVGCTQKTENTSDDSTALSHGTSTQGCLSYAEAKAAYERRVQAEADKLQAEYNAALAQVDEETLEAKRVRDEKLHSLPQDPSSNASGEIYNGVILEYNHTLDSIEAAYQARVTVARGRYDQAIQAAKDAYYASICQ